MKIQFAKKLLLKKVLKEIYNLPAENKLNVFDKIMPQVTSLSEVERSVLIVMSDEDKIAYLNYQLQAALSLRPELIRGYQYLARSILYQYIDKE